MNALSYVHGVSKEKLLGETIGQNLKKTVLQFGEQDALVSIHQNYRSTYRQFYEQTTTIAQSLIFHQIKKGDRVGIWSPNCYEWVILQYATARLGIILVNLNPSYRTQEVAYAIKQSGIKMVISASEFRTSNYRKMLENIQDECPSLEKIIFLGEEWNRFIEDGKAISISEVEEREKHIEFYEPINIQYTSGTTGFPKGVTLSHHNILNNGYFIAKRLRYTSEDRVCIPVPFYHCFGMVIGNLACTTHGACIVIPNDSFDPGKTLLAVQQERCTSLYGVPTMFITELALPNFKDFDLSTLRKGVMAGSLCPPEIMKRVQNEMNMKEISICYGMTETSPVSTQTQIGTPFEKQVSTVGTIMDHLEIKIIDPDTKAIVPRGTSGELCTRGYSVMLKYWNDPEKTREVLDEGRWMHSGDFAVMDNEGYITITGRIKDLIIRGGENISPKWIEDYLYTHPKIQDVQVIGVPNAKYGEEVMAWVKLQPGETISETELTAYCDQKIAHYCIPKYWKFVEAFPMTISGKIRKIEMREISTKELGLEHLK